MPALLNQKHERFAELMSWPNAEQRSSYLTAGFHAKNGNSADAAASNLIRRPEVAARIREIRLNREAELGVNVQNVLSEIGPKDDGGFTRVGRAKVLAIHRRRLHQIIEERAAAPEHQNLPGGKTGFVVVKGTKAIRRKVLMHSKDPGAKPTEVEKVEKTIISAVDMKFISALLAVDEQIARELGQWVEKQDDTLRVRKLDDLTDEMLDELIKDAVSIQAREAANKAGESIQ
jgi:Terminase small subunit